MKKPTKKSTIPALALAGVLGYNTIGDKVNSEYQNTNQPQAQVEVANKNYAQSALENITQALAPNKAHAGSNQDYERPDDATLKEWMNQPVEETLAGTDYTKVNDNNYKKEVLEADRPTMVLFYNNHGMDSSTGLAALTKTLHKKFPEIKLCAYKLSDGDETPRHVYNHVTSEYGLEKTPALLNYKFNKDGQLEYDAGLHGGIKSIEYFDRNLKLGTEYIKSEILK